MIEFKKTSEFPKGTLYKQLVDAYSFNDNCKKTWDDMWKEHDEFFYSNQDMSKEFNSAVVLDTTYFMSIYFKINDKSYKATITQKDSIKNNDNYYYGYDIYIADLSY